MDNLPGKSESPPLNASDLHDKSTRFRRGRHACGPMFRVRFLTPASLLLCCVGSGCDRPTASRPTQFSEAQIEQYERLVEPEQQSTAKELEEMIRP